MATGRFIGVDWGSSNVRAFRFSDAGIVVETKRSDRGSATLATADYEGALKDLLGDWLATPPEKIVICGMAGSREGWVEAPYLPCPCDLWAIAAATKRAPTALPAFIAPGLSSRGADGVHDVLRGEETQMLGAQPKRDAWLITPGTHSKWAETLNGAIVRFHTYMTGEVFRLLATQSVLSRTLDIGASFDGDAFDRGAARGLEQRAITNLAFAARAQSLLGSLSPHAAKSYLSGLLIGAEIADGLQNDGPTQCVLIGAEDIAKLYRRALIRAGAHDVSVIDGEAAAAHGLWRIAHGGNAL